MENISLRDVADELGLRVETRTDNRIDYFCPIHDQETGDLSLYPESHFACHKKGGESPVTLLMHCKGFTFEEAKEWMAEKFPEKWGSEKIDKEHIERKQKVQEVLDKAVELSQGQLTEKQEQSICEKRNLEHKDILEHKVGYFNQKVVETLKERYSKQVLKNSGLFSYNENGLYPFLKDRIVIPYLKFDKVRYLIGRKTKESKDAKYKKLKQTEYNEHILWTYEKPKKNCLVITEGIYDAISVAKAGYPVCSPVTTQFSKKQVDKVVNYAKNFEEVYIAMDGDEAGQEGQEKTAILLANKEVTVNLVSLPEGMDFDDWTTENGYDISVLLEESKSFVQSIIENHNKAESLKQTDIAREEIYPVIKNWSTGKRSKVFKELDGNKRDTETDYKEWLEEKESQKKPQHEDNEEDEDNEAHSLSLSNLLEEVKPEKVRLSGELEDGEYFYTIPVTKGERTIPLVITSNKEIIQVKHKLKEKRKKRDGELSKEDRKAYDYRYFEYNGKEYRFKHKPVFFQQLDLYNNDNSVLKYLEENNPSKDVYRRVRERIKKYWDHPNSEYFDVATAWVIHTYLINNIGYTVYLMLKGLEDTGKSTLQKILARLSYNGFFTGKTTPAVSSRLAHFTQSSIQIDEFEKLGEEAKTQIQGVFNTGQRRGGKYQFTNINKEDVEDQIEALHSFCAKTLSVNNLRGFERSFLSRNIIIDAVKTNRNIEKIENIDKEERAEFQSIRNELMAFCLFNHEDLVKTVRSFKEGLEAKGRKSDKLGIIGGIVKLFKGEERAEKVMDRLKSSKNLQDDDLTDRNKLLLEVLVNEFKNAEEKSGNELKNQDFKLKFLSKRLNDKLGLSDDSEYKATSRSVAKTLRELGILRDNSQKTRKASGTVVFVPKNVLRDSLERYDYRGLIGTLFQKVDEKDTQTNSGKDNSGGSLSSSSSLSSVQDVAESVKKESGETVIDQTVKKLNRLGKDLGEGEFQEIAQEIHDQHKVGRDFAESQLKEGVQT